MDDDKWDDEEFRKNYYAELKKMGCTIGGNIILFGLPSKESVAHYNKVREFFYMSPSCDAVFQNETLFDLIRKDVPSKYLDEFDRYFNFNGDE